LGLGVAMPTCAPATTAHRAVAVVMNGRMKPTRR
jgi:hypothetical protein